MVKKEHLHVRIDVRDLELLDSLSKYYGMTKSQLVRIQILQNHEYLINNGLIKAE